MAYSTGLLSFMLVKVLATGFYSRQDTKRPVKYGIIAMAANMVFNIALAIPFSYVGLALATAASAAINAGLLGVTLWREGVLKKQPGTGRFIFQVLFATTAMIAGVLWLSPDIATWRTSSLVERPWLLAQVIGFGALIYIAVLVITGMRPRHFRAREY
tara:strand:- start:863 stop:1336 length:474 start_codon:yes stop_codon:yes gene_type:complete